MTSISAVVPAYTLDRWSLIERTMDALLNQSVEAREIVLSIDNNAILFERCLARWPVSDFPRVQVLLNAPDADDARELAEHERAHGSRRRFGAGGARNLAVKATTADVVAFIDDDAVATNRWLENLLRHYEDEQIVAVGGPPEPDFATTRPPWFPTSFDWVIGCAHAGLPDSLSHVRHLIGANMSVRRSAFDAVGGFQSIDFDDLDLCMRLVHRYGTDGLLFDPAAVVHHHVPADRVTWRYFYRRCFFVNVGKVEAFENLGDSANLIAEIEFVLKVLRRDCWRELRRVGRGDFAGAAAAAAIFVGILLSGLGNLWGRVKRLRNGAR